MTSELRTLLELLGPGRMLSNARAMSHAREPIRGYVTTIVYWALIKNEFVDALMTRDRVGSACVRRTTRSERRIAGFDVYLSDATGPPEASDECCSLTRAGRRFCEDSLGVLNIFSAYQPFFSDLESCLRKEQTLDALQRLDERVALGFRETGAKFTFSALSTLLRKYQVDSLIELGCGNIDFSLYACQNLPQLRCAGIDWDQRFLAEARETIATSALADRVQLIEWDLFAIESCEADFTDYRAVTAVDLFHGYFYEGRERLLSLLTGLRRKFAGKRFFVSEMCLADESRMRKISYPMVEHELFHGLTRQKTFAAGELEALVQEAGFRMVEQRTARNLGGQNLSCV